MIGLEVEVAATRLRSHRIAGDASQRRPRLASPAAPRIAGHAARRAEGVPVRRWALEYMFGLLGQLPEVAVPYGTLPVKRPKAQ